MGIQLHGPRASAFGKNKQKLTFCSASPISAAYQTWYFDPHAHPGLIKKTCGNSILMDKTVGIQFHGPREFLFGKKKNTKTNL
jgi:hypothetical protein